MEALSKTEFRALLRRAHRDDRALWLMMVLHFWHGARNSEVIHLTRDNFIGDSILFARGKGSLPCKQKLVEHKNPLLNERSVVLAFIRKLHPKQRLFPISRWTYWRRMKACALAAGIDPLKANTVVLKHTLCTYLFAKIGANMVRRRAGHKAGSSTLIYGEVSEATVDSVVARAVAL